MLVDYLKEFQTPTSPRVHEGRDRRTVMATVHEILAEELGLEKEDVTPSAVLVYDLGADALDLVVIMMALETEFHVTIEDADFEGVCTVQDVQTLIERKLG